MPAIRCCFQCSRRKSDRGWLALGAVVVWLACLTTTPQPVAAQPRPQAAAPMPSAMPGLRIDRDRGLVDVAATVVYREGDWLELIACTAGTREYESLVRIEARPRHIHLALVLLGLKPGQPLSWRQREDGEFVVLAPRGPEVAVSFVLEANPAPAAATDTGPESPAVSDRPARPAREDPDAPPPLAEWPRGEVVEVPAYRWVRDQKTGRPMPATNWLFAGSQWVERDDGPPIYLADANGTAVSIVNFGDDLLARPVTTTDRDDQAQWNADFAALPPSGTRVWLRLRPAEPRAAHDEAPQGRGQPD